MKIPFLFGLAGIVGALVAAQADSVLEKHTQQLQTAKTLSASYTVQNFPGGPVEYKLKLAKPSKFRLETPDEIIVADGSTISTYNKAKNSYTQAAQSEGDLKKLLKRDAVLPWAAFFTKEPFKEASGIKIGSKHMIKGKAVTDVSITLAGTPVRTATLFIDQDLGIARGVDLKTAPDKESIIMAKEISVAADAAKDSDFEFSAPEGAKKIEPGAASAGTTWEKVAPIFQTNCGGCHNSSRPKSGLDLTTYAGAMAGGRAGRCITAGDADNSPLMAYLKGSGKPQMPPNGSISDADMATIAAWIKDGAVEK